MKTNRRILGVFLALLVCLSTAVVAVSAEETINYDKIYKEMVFASLGDKVGMHHNFRCDYVYNADGSTPKEGEMPDYLLCHISSNVALKDVVECVIGDYYFYNYYMYIPFELPYCIYSTSENKCYSLEEAWETKLPNIENVLAMIGKKGDLYIESFEEYLKTEHKNAYNEVAGHYDTEEGSCYSYKEVYYYTDGKGTEEIPEATPDYVLIDGTLNAGSPSCSFGIISDYVVLCTNCGNPYCLRYFVYTPENNKTYTLTEAYNAGVEGIENVFTDFGLGYLMGDADNDRRLTIKDATYIQKYIAKVEGIEAPEGLNGHNIDQSDDNFVSVADFDNNNNINIKDATAIQKRLAKLG